MGRLDLYQVEKRTNNAITVEAGNGPGRWAEDGSDGALRRLDAKLNPDHGSANPPLSVGNGDELEHRSLIAFSEGSAGALVDSGTDVSEASWDDIRPTEF